MISFAVCRLLGVCMVFLSLSLSLLARFFFIVFSEHTLSSDNCHLSVCYALVYFSFLTFYFKQQHPNRYPTSNCALHTINTFYIRYRYRMRDKDLTHPNITNKYKIYVGISINYGFSKLNYNKIK